jgi:hypothetical protein
VFLYGENGEFSLALNHGTRNQIVKSLNFIANNIRGQNRKMCTRSWKVPDLFITMAFLINNFGDILVDFQQILELANPTMK